MSAERLREAAQVLRGLAEDATPGRWECNTTQTRGDWSEAGRGAVHRILPGNLAVVGTRPDAAYIATVSPPFALAVADLLDEIAVRWDWVEERDLALAVADAVLEVGADRAGEGS